MNCPKCGYVSFDHLNECKNCGQDLLEHKIKLGIKSFKKRESSAHAQDVDHPQEILPQSYSETTIEVEPVNTATEVAEEEIFSLDDVSFENGLGEIEPNEALEIEIDISEFEDKEGDEKPDSVPEKDSFHPDELSIDINDASLSSKLDDVFEDNEDAPEAIETDDTQQAATSDTQAIDISPEYDQEDQESEEVEPEISDKIDEEIEDDDEPWFEEVGDAFTRQENEEEEASPLFEDVAGKELSPNLNDNEEDSIQMPLEFVKKSELPETEEVMGEGIQEDAVPIVNKAVFFKRGLALAIDGAILLGTIYLFLYSGLFILKSKALISTSSLPMGIITTTLLAPTILITLVVSAAYFSFFHGTTGQTPGKMLVGLKVVGLNNGSITIGKAFLRWFGYIVSFLPLMGGFLMAFKDKKSQSLHDKIADTLVVALSPQTVMEEEASELPLEEGQE